MIGTLSRPACRHCQQVRNLVCRGLCWVCYYNSAVRAQYPAAQNYGRRGLGLEDMPRRLPEPTAAWPGSAEKLAALIERAARGELLFHPQDAGAGE